MGQITINYCDRHGDRVDVRASHIGFQLEFDGTPAEIDLCDACHEELKDAVAPFIAAARKAANIAAKVAVRKVAPRGAEEGPPKRKPAKLDPEQAKHIRAWCNENGIKVAPVGGIPKRALVEYNAAHGNGKRRASPAAPEPQYCASLEAYRQQALTWLMVHGEYVPQTGPTRPQLVRYTERTGWHPPKPEVAAG